MKEGRPIIERLKYVAGELFGKVRGVIDISRIQELGPEYLAKINKIIESGHRNINCHGTSSYLAGLINTPRGVETEELSKLLEGISPDEHLTPNSIICNKTTKGVITHSGILIRARGEDYILHKRGYDDPIEIVPLVGVFPTGVKIISYSRATQNLTLK